MEEAVADPSWQLSNVDDSLYPDRSRQVTISPRRIGLCLLTPWVLLHNADQETFRFGSPDAYHLPPL